MRLIPMACLRKHNEEFGPESSVDGDYLIYL